MNKFFTFMALTLLFTGAGCNDLSVDNLNSPDRELALAEPGDVENLIGGGFLNVWSAQQYAEPNMLLTTMADENSSAWANFAMRDMSSEPRIAWDNSPAYNRDAGNRLPWFRSYTAISNMNDGLQAIARAEAAESETDNAYTRAGIDVNRLKAFAKFHQAWAHAWLAMMFDQAFIVDETVDLEAVAAGDIVLELQPYTAVLAAAIQQMDAALAIAQANEFTITATEDWIFGLDVTSAQLVQLGNSLKARWLAQVGRTAAERDAADWNQIITLISAGITEDFVPVGDDDSVEEWDATKFYGQNGTTWSRADYRTIGAADESGGYQNWLATPVQERVVFDIATADRRIVGDPVDLTVNGKYFEYQGNNGPFPPARGTYHYSSHNHFRFVEYNAAGANGPMPYMLTSEMDMLHAEALLRTGGSTETIAQLINNTRVPNGELNPAASTDPIGASTDDHSHLDTASLWAKMKYEKRIETFQTAAGLAYFDDRGWGDLVTNTPIHFPIPGRELETLGVQQYTFGGGGDGSAPKAGDSYWMNKPARETVR